MDTSVNNADIESYFQTVLRQRNDGKGRDYMGVGIWSTHLIMSIKTNWNYSVVTVLWKMELINIIGRTCSYMCTYICVTDIHDIMRYLANGYN